MYISWYGNANVGKIMYSSELLVLAKFMFGFGEGKLKVQICVLWIWQMLKTSNV